MTSNNTKLQCVHIGIVSMLNASSSKDDAVYAESRIVDLHLHFGQFSQQKRKQQQPNTRWNSGWDALE